MSKKQEQEIKDLKELVTDLFEESVVEDMIEDMKVNFKGRTFDDDLHLAHLIFLKDRVLAATKE